MPDKYYDQDSRLASLFINSGSTADAVRERLAVVRLAQAAVVEFDALLAKGLSAPDPEVLDREGDEPAPVADSPQKAAITAYREYRTAFTQTGFDQFPACDIFEFCWVYPIKTIEAVNQGSQKVLSRDAFRFGNRFL